MKLDSIKRVSSIEMEWFSKSTTDSAKKWAPVMLARSGNAGIRHLELPGLSGLLGRID